MMFEAFSMVDGKSDGTTATDDRKLSPDEWSAGIGKLNEFGNTHNFVAMKGAKADDFATIDSDGHGAVLLVEFCKWVEKAEIAAGTDYGKDLAVGDDDE